MSIELHTPAAPSTDHTTATATTVTMPTRDREQERRLHHRPGVDVGQPEPCLAAYATGWAGLRRGVVAGLGRLPRSRRSAPRPSTWSAPASPACPAPAEAGQHRPRCAAWPPGRRTSCATSRAGTTRTARPCPDRPATGAGRQASRRNVGRPSGLLCLSVVPVGQVGDGLHRGWPPPGHLPRLWHSGPRRRLIRCPAWTRCCGRPRPPRRRWLTPTNFTPLVSRLVGRRCSSTALRVTCPDCLMASTSSPSTTMKPPTSVAPVVVLLHGLDAEPAPGLQAVLLDPRALGEPTVGDREDVLLRGAPRPPHWGRITDIDSMLSPAAELHPRHARRRTAHRAQLVVVGPEADRLALAGDQQDVVVGTDQLGADQLVVVVAEVDRDDAGLARGVVVAQPGLLDQAGLRVARTRYGACS